MSDAVQLAIVGAAVFAAVVYLGARFRRPRRTCDACPPEPGSERLVQLGRRPPVTGAGRRPPSAS